MAELPASLITYFANRQAARADRVRAFLDSLTDRERALVEQAAVMGYVRGSMAPRGEEIPLNKEILAEVVDACFVYPDLYPVFNADLAPHPATSTWTFEANYAPGKWHGIGGTYPEDVYDKAHDKAVEYFKSRIASDPKSRIRMVCADTVYTVVAEHDPAESS
ncbi:hypothetical protein [Streptomyces mirabilis]|uniref:hypothetical protein n=1 Tax=Streptomyces mirabilis TaxID=68239 RepID=UPI003408CBAA